jgi:hypothetical protein
LVSIWKQPFNSPDGIGALTAKTDPEGKYRLQLAAGSYYASANANGFFEIENGSVSQQLKSVTVLSGEVSSNVDFDVLKGGVITGKITNPDNAPVIELPVVLLPVDSKQAPVLSGRSQFSGSTNGRTDDRGIYRLFGIPPGRYKLAVGETFGAYAAGRSNLAYHRTFYPGTAEDTKATVVEIKPGAELTGFDLKLEPPESTFTISGKVVDGETGLPIAEISCGLEIFVNGKQEGGLSGMNFANKRGEFTIQKIPAGHYSISVPSHLYVSAMPAPNYFGESGQFEVVDEDVSGIVVKATRAASVSGSIVVEGEVDKKLLTQLQNLRFTVISIPSQPGNVSAKGFAPGPDFTFFIDGLRPGKLNIYPNQPSTRETNPFKMIRMDWLGVQQKEPIELKAGDQIADLKLVMVYAPGGVRGVIKLASGSLPENLRGTVMLYRDNEQIAWSVVDGRGNFLLENVPRGVYRMIVNLQLSGVSPASARSEQIVEVSEKISELVVLLDPKPNP